MATLSQYSFIPRTIMGSMIGASQVQPTGTDGYYYFDVVKDVQAAAPAAVTNVSANLNSYQSGSSSGKRIGVIAYDYVQARWSCLFIVGGVVLVKNGWLDDLGAIKDFMASLATPQTTAESTNQQAGDPLPYPASLAPLGA